MKVTAKPLPPVNLPELRQVGKPLRRVDSLGKAVGATLFAADFSLPNMLYAKVFRSRLPSARLTRIDVSKARALPGVVCVLTHEDLLSDVLVTDMPGQTGTARRAGSDTHVLAADIVRFIGDPIALVAAETLPIAEKALTLIEVDYEELPAVYDPLEAMKPGAPIVSQPDNIVARWKVRKGNVEQGMAAADLIVENTFRVPFVDHAYLEPEAGVAWVDDRSVVNIRVSTQVVEHYRSIALALGVPHNKLHIQGTMVGGGFGGKEDITVEIFLGLLTIKSGRPVKMEYTREESIQAHSKRHPFIITHKTGVTRDGRITAAEIKMISNSGAYVYLTPYVLLYATGTAPGPYRVDNLTVDSYGVATNNPFSSAFRGFGVPQAAFAHEQQMDDIAHKLGMDPYEFRRLNYIKTGDSTANQVVRTATWLEETASRVLEALGEKTPDHGAVKVGQGFASYLQSYGRISWFHDTSQAWVGAGDGRHAHHPLGHPRPGRRADLGSVPDRRRGAGCADGAHLGLQHRFQPSRRFRERRQPRASCTCLAMRCCRHPGLCARCSWTGPPSTSKSRPRTWTWLTARCSFETTRSNPCRWPNWPPCVRLKVCPWPTWRCSRGLSPGRSTRKPDRAMYGLISPSALMALRWPWTPRPAK